MPIPTALSLSAAVIGRRELSSAITHAAWLRSLCEFALAIKEGHLSIGCPIPSLGTVAPVSRQSSHSRGIALNSIADPVLPRSEVQQYRCLACAQYSERSCNSGSPNH
eukprot:scaffold101_cov567-Pavlova_lutheri.AAC.3